jgi:UDP-N-acetylmuramyl pentapeptide phosphotransferase/UDP-N-acetylglucosamine-1-phosphate transferase
MTAGAFVFGAIASALLWLGMRATFRRDVFARANVHGRAVPTGVGVVIVVAALLLEAVVTLADALGADVDTATIGPRRIVLLAAVGFGLLGLLDDLGGVGESGGFRAHLRALAHGRITTGAVKLFGGAALAIVAIAAAEADPSGARLIADAALVALAANLGNLLDRAPGRVAKVSLLAFIALVLATGLDPRLAGVAAIVGGAAGLLVPDLREQLMLGDAGANVLGAVLALGVVLTCSPGVRIVLLVVVAALNVASELVSFSRVIERVAPLRALDRAGRRA